MSDTPRTDALALVTQVDTGNRIERVTCVPADFARELERENARLISALADAAGYLASVRTDRKMKDQFGDVFVGQTAEWAEGAKEIADNANTLLDEHDAAMQSTPQPAG